MVRLRSWGASFVVVAVVAALAAMPARAADDNAELARTLIDRFYDALAPDSTALAGLLGDSFQIIGTDGHRFDRREYLAFPKAITEYAVSDIVARRDGDVLTATFEITYRGRFEGGERTVPALPRLAVFRKVDDAWQLVAVAALGTGINDVTAEAGKALAGFFEAVASGDAERIRAVVSPDYQIQRSNGEGFTLDAYLSGNLPVLETVPVVQDLVATSFNTTMVTRYRLQVDETIGGAKIEALAPRMTVFQRINGQWRVAAHANFAAIE